jgi:hypothetical protein
MRGVTSIRLKPWQDGFIAFFSLAAADWGRPSVVRSAVNADRTRMTMQGSFRQPDGTRVKLTTVCRREGEEWFIVKESLDLRLTFAGTPVAP